MLGDVPAVTPVVGPAGHPTGIRGHGHLPIPGPSPASEPPARAAAPNDVPTGAAPAAPDRPATTSAASSAPGAPATAVAPAGAAPAPPRPTRGPVPPVGPDDFERPSSARVYDHLLGGAAHGAVDRALAAAMLQAEPHVVDAVRENRSFLRRAVRFLLAAGIGQFLDLGSGVPTMGNVHEIVARAGSRARVVYTDLDPVALAHGQQLLAGVPDAVFLGADLRDVDAVLDAAFTAGGLDPDRPVGLLAFSVFQHVPDADDPVSVLGRYLEPLVPGSTLALSHLTGDDDRTAMSAVEDLAAAYSRTTPQLRGHDEVARLVTGVDLVEPGLSWASRWRPDPGRPPRPTDVCAHWAAVGFLR